MIIVDRDLRRLIQERLIVIQSINEDLPFNPQSQIGPGSIDLRLNNTVRKYKKDVSMIDLSLAGDTESVEIPPNGDLIIHPNEMILATTLEIVVLPPNIAGLIAGRSSIARLGLLVHIAQSYMQPGHSQLVPLQLVNVTDRPIKIKPFLPICQVTLLNTSSNAETPYSVKKNAKYSSELLEPQPSKIGVELGLEKLEQVSTDKTSAKYQEIQEDIQRLRKETSGTSTRNEFQKKLSDVLILIYIILGASVSLLIQEISVRPFPSLTFLVSGTFLIFCIIIIIVNWRR